MSSPAEILYLPIPSPIVEEVNRVLDVDPATSFPSPVLHLATQSTEGPYISDVWATVDSLEQPTAFYWLSRPDRTHSQHIAVDRRVAGSMSVAHRCSEPVASIRFTGWAQQLPEGSYRDGALELLLQRKVFQPWEFKKYLHTPPPGIPPHEVYVGWVKRWLLFDGNRTSSNMVHRLREEMPTFL